MASTAAPVNGAQIASELANGREPALIYPRAMLLIQPAGRPPAAVANNQGDCPKRV